MKEILLIHFAGFGVAFLNSHAAPFQSSPGDYYEIVDSPAISLGDADAEARASVFGGKHGHLVTITSAAEDQFVLGLIYADMPVTVITDSAPERPYSGKIGFISPTAEFTPKTVETRELRTDLVYRLRVVVDNPDGGLRQGMPVTVRLPLPEARKRTFWQRVRSAIPQELNPLHDR